MFFHFQITVFSNKFNTTLEYMSIKHATTKYKEKIKWKENVEIKTDTE